jgi:hypothetical protein
VEASPQKEAETKHICIAAAWVQEREYEWGTRTKNHKAMAERVRKYRWLCLTALYSFREPESLVKNRWYLGTPYAKPTQSEYLWCEETSNWKKVLKFIWWEQFEVSLVLESGSVFGST